nr:MAG TPA: hypothetical protein [Crassvirales sp.]
MQLKATTQSVGQLRINLDGTKISKKNDKSKFIRKKL